MQESAIASPYARWIDRAQDPGKYPHCSKDSLLKRECRKEMNYAIVD